MTADVLGQRMNDDICAMIDWLAEVGRGDRIIYDKRNTMFVCNLGQFFDIDDVTCRVAD